MKGILDYLEYYGNSSFNELAFNDVDSLILTQLVYAKLKGMAPESKIISKRLVDVCSLFLAKYSEKDFKKEDYLFPNSYRLVLALQSSKRYMDARVSYYIEEATSETQFGAMTVRFNQGICYVAYEGTDSSIVGWAEDFKLMYEYPTLSQKRGKEYLENTISIFDRKIYVGGHSKGGNIAMYAYMNVPNNIRKKIVNVYNFDGPGFLEDVMNTNIYQEMLSKLKMFVPEQSVIGMIFGHKEYEVIKSHGLGILQHDPYTWCCFGGKLELGVLSKKSKKLEENLKKYLLNMPIEERKLFVKTLVDFCDNLGIKNVMQVREITPNSIINFLKNFINVPERMKKRFIDVLKMLVWGAS